LFWPANRRFHGPVSRGDPGAAFHNYCNLQLERWSVLVLVDCQESINWIFADPDAGIVIEGHTGGRLVKRRGLVEVRIRVLLTVRAATARAIRHSSFRQIGQAVTYRRLG
jgi:hypothetical protein